MRSLLNAVGSLIRLPSRLEGSSVISFDCETTGLNTTPGYDRMVGYSVAWVDAHGETQSAYVPFRHATGKQVNERAAVRMLERILYGRTVVFHHAKFDVAMLMNEGIDPSMFSLRDTQLMHYCWKSDCFDRGLKTLARDLLGRNPATFEDTVRGKLFAQLDPLDGYAYACDDAENTLDLYNLFMGSEAFEELGAVMEIEHNCVVPLIRMEQARVTVDVDLLDTMLADKQGELDRITQELTNATGLSNLNSTAQWREYLFGADGLAEYDDAWGLTDSGQLKVTKAVHKELAKELDESKLYLEYAKAKKLVRTYLENIKANLYPDGTAKFCIKQHGAGTGRMSSPGGFGLSHPKKSDGYIGVNGQNIPYRILGCLFRSRKGFRCFGFDFANQEMRVAANLAKVESWIYEFTKGNADAHAATAESAGTDRSVGKTCNFALLYGASDSKVADTITQGGNAVTKLDVRFIFDDFYDNNPELKEWMQECMDRADETHCAFTPFGRVRDLSDFYERGDIAGARRRAINTPIQGGCGDWLKLCLPQIDKLLVEEYPGKAFVTMLIHDELVVDIDESDEELMWEIVARIRAAMVNEPLRRKVGWPVPLAVDIEGGYTWS